MSVISKEAEWKYSSYILNKNHKFDKIEILNTLNKSEIDEAYRTISSWNNYNSTPLLLLNKLSKDLNY